MTMRAAAHLSASSAIYVKDRPWRAVEELRCLLERHGYVLMLKVPPFSL